MYSVISVSTPSNIELLEYICLLHYGDVIMGATASQITSLSIVYSTVFFSGADQRKHQSSASLAFFVVYSWWLHDVHHVPNQFPFVSVIYHLPGNSSTKDQYHRVLDSFSLAWIMFWVYTGVASEMRRLNAQHHIRISYQTNLPIEQPSSEIHGFLKPPLAFSESALKYPAAHTPCWDHISLYFLLGRRWL